MSYAILFMNSSINEVLGSACYCCFADCNSVKCIMRYEGYFLNYNTLAFPCFAAGTILKWKVDKYLMAISSSHKDTGGFEPKNTHLRTVDSRTV